MEATAPAQSNFLVRAVCECGRCLRQPLRLFLLFIFWRVQQLDDPRAIRFMLRLRRFIPWPSRKIRSRNLEMTGIAAQWTSGQKKQFEQRRREYLARMNVHLIRLWKQTPADFCEFVRASGFEHIQRAASGGQGVLLLMPHSGTWIHISIYASLRGLCVNGFLNPDLPATVRQYLAALGARYGIITSFVGQSGYDAARVAFGRGEIVTTAVDLSLRGKRTAWLPFGAAELQMDPGSAVLAIRQRVPVVWANAFHDEQGRPCIEFLPAQTYGPGTSRTTPGAVLSHWAELIHENFQRRPEQWWALNFCSLRRAQNLKSAPDTICA